MLLWRDSFFPFSPTMLAGFICTSSSSPICVNLCPCASSVVVVVSVSLSSYTCHMLTIGLLSCRSMFVSCMWLMAFLSCCLQARQGRHSALRPSCLYVSSCSSIRFSSSSFISSAICLWTATSTICFLNTIAPSILFLFLDILDGILLFSHHSIKSWMFMLSLIGPVIWSLATFIPHKLGLSRHAFSSASLLVLSTSILFLEISLSIFNQDYAHIHLHLHLSIFRYNPTWHCHHGWSSFIWDWKSSILCITSSYNWNHQMSFSFALSLFFLLSHLFSSVSFLWLCDASCVCLIDVFVWMEGLMFLSASVSLIYSL